MKKITKISLILALAVILVITSACNSNNNTSENTNSSGNNSVKDTTPAKKSLKIGTSSVSIDLAESGVAPLEDMGYEVEIVVFDDYFTPNTALVEGSLDANFYQHELFMDQYNVSKKTDIIMLSPKLYQFYGGLYSVKANSLETLPDGGKVGIATDASNISRDLINLQSLGLITLTSEPRDLYSVLDIVDNPHNYEFVQSDHMKYTYMDEYTFLLGTSNTMAANQVDPTKNRLAYFPEPDNALGMCVMPANENEQWVKDIMTAYTSEAARAYVKPSSGFEPVK
ncbi:MetQ/NlpA family ABC transporter substrate-binding protein [Dehalobacterium formicoaceticum]|uniref:MetQ/NlpA family ABC transporter substrate-binding protein n=1 Tax=Dehalobacterium formicoaceticum TaxID=51515 RepID=A0ABT1Y4E7_9FIRM|nr:MetQ/NlpA family ABC transporter substrate-binding protein [Dehalobacterium formicoaceticum]MCR6545748.1 MetQ/NlpA family ABC transporter substrate-binding protein [Dehalobacterium formicoaceticum]